MPQKQIVSIPFATGQKDKQSAVWLESGTNTTVTNGIFVKANTVQKRPGSATLSKTEASSGLGASNLAVAKRLASYRNELLLFDGQYLRSYIEQLNQWLVKDETSPCVATRETIAQMSPGVFDGDVVECGGFRVYVWTDAVGANAAIYFAVQDIANGLVTSTGYVGNTSATGRLPKLLQLSGTNVILVHQRSSDNAIVGRSMSVAANPVWTGQTVIVAGAGTKAAVAFDAVAATGSSIFVVAYENNAGVIKVIEVSSAFSVLLTATCTDANTGYTAISLRADVSSNIIWLGFSYNAGNDVKMSCYAYSTGVETQAPFTIYSGAINYGRNIGIEQLDSTHAVVVIGTTTSKGLQWGVFSSIGGTTLALKQGYNMSLQSRPVLVASLDSVYGVRCYALVTHATPANQMTQFLVELDVRTSAAGSQAPHPVATLSPRFSSTSSFVLRSASTLTNGTILGNSAATSFVTFGSVAESLNGVGAVSALTFDFNHPGAYTTAELGGSLYVSGGIPSVYDGNVLAEIGSLVTADGATTGNAVGGSLQASQTYSYVFVVEWRDYKGQRHQGQPSLPVTGTTTGTNFKITLTVPQINLTTMTDFFVSNPNVGIPYIVPYRTVYSGGAMGTVFHRIVSDSPSPFAGSVNPNNETFSFTDDGTGAFADATAASAEQLYTTGGVVESDCPPSFTTLCSHRGRVFGVADDQRTIWYSTSYVPGAPVRFNDGFTLSVEEGGPIIGLCGLENYLVVFKTDSIYYFTFQNGPNLLGDQNDISGPTKLPVDVGCKDVRSILLTPQGVAFRTRTGMAMLDRGLGLRSDFGDPVENTLGAGAGVVKAALIHPTRPEYWFEMASSASASEVNGKSLVYNYRFDAWSIASRYDNDKSRAAALYNGSVSLNGTMYIATPFGQVNSEFAHTSTASNSFKDGGAADANYVTMTVETAWLKPSMTEGVTRVSGFGRVWKGMLSQEWKDYHILTISAAYDYSASYTDIFTFPASTHGSATFDEFEVNMSRPLCEAVRLKFADTPSAINPSTTGQGAILTGVTAEVAASLGANRLPDARRK